MKEAFTGSGFTVQGYLSFDDLLTFDGLVKILLTRHIARSKATKQYPNFKLLQPMRLLRYARNDIKSDFLRVHQPLNPEP